MTYSTLQTLNTDVPKISQTFVPGDDASVANYLAHQYAEQGLDPSSAYDNPEDILNDFGGPEAFR